ncbi:hypothetical protein EXIGLDRAFT_777072, partial [Exidia glandulosa HHB12029]
MANNTQAALNLTADRAAVIAAEMLIVVCGDRQAARAAVAYTFLATAVYAAVTAPHICLGGRTLREEEVGRGDRVRTTW